MQGTLKRYYVEILPFIELKKKLKDSQSKLKIYIRECGTISDCKM